jgi:hypothetical protein
MDRALDGAPDGCRPVTDRRRHQMDRSLRDPAAYWSLLFSAMIGVVGLSMVAETPGDWFPYLMLLMAGGLGSAAVAHSDLGLRPERRVSSDGPRVTVRFRRVAAVGTAVGVTTLTAFFGAVIRLFLGDPAFWLVAACLALMIALSVRLVPVAFRDCRLVLDPDGLEIVSWFEDGTVLWDDVVLPIELESMGRTRTLRLRVDPQAPPPRQRRHRIPLLEWGMDRRSFVLHTDGLDDPMRLVEVVTRLRGLDRNLRTALLSHGFPEYLRGEPHADRLIHLRPGR